MILTTTPSIEGKTISEYKGIVVGETIIGANIFRDIFASITDIVGGRSAQYEQALSEARSIAFAEMQAQATEKNANAIIGIDIDYEVIRDGMLMVTTSGTAVVVS